MLYTTRRQHKSKAKIPTPVQYACARCQQLDRAQQGASRHARYPETKGRKSLTRPLLRCAAGGVRGGGLSEPRSPVVPFVFTPLTSAADRSTNCARPLGASMVTCPPRAETPVYVFCRGASKGIRGAGC
jgi:hypothetical protein